MEQEILEKTLNLVQMHSDLKAIMKERYYNTRAVISTTISKPLMELKFDLSDLMLIGAITQSNIILSGSSGSGKTYLAELVSTALFGSRNYARKNITPDMNEQDFMDIDFGAIKEGKKLKEALLADDLLSKPCLIIDEANRAPPIVQNRLMQLLENNIDLKSKNIKAGIELPDGDHYHWNILTLNYGDEYSGTSRVDRALKDRIVIDIPIDNFPPTIDDQVHMIRNENKKKMKEINDASNIVFNLNILLRKIELSVEAEALLLYMSFCSDCVKSKTNSKYGINFSPQFCKDKDCPYARNPPLNKICPYTFAPSNRVLRRLVHVAKGFTLLKNAKIINHLIENNGEEDAIKFALNNLKWEVSQGDLIAIAPFILHSKISMNLEWLVQKFNGNSFLGCQEFLKVVNSRLEFFMKNVLMVLIKEKNGETLSEKDRGKRNRALKEDFHYEGLIKYVFEYLG